METIAEGHVIIELVRNNFFMHFLNLSDISRFICCCYCITISQEGEICAELVAHDG